MSGGGGGGGDTGTVEHSQRNFNNAWLLTAAERTPRYTTGNKL